MNITKAVKEICARVTAQNSDFVFFFVRVYFLP